MQGNFDVVAFDNPFSKPVVQNEMSEGISVAEIIQRSDIDPAIYLNLQVTISLGGRSSEISFTDWHRCRPKRGCLVRVTPRVEAVVLAPLLTTLITAAAPTLAGLLFPTLAAGSIGLALATAAISVVGALAIRALVPPPKQAGSAAADDPVFTLTGASNTAKPHDAYPTVIGRHIMFPSKTATGYTETVEDEIYLRERMTFGYGPISLETLKIGTTNITDFEDVEIEFLNVDQARTLANIPELATAEGITVVGWRQGTQAMTLYPTDIAEDTYSVLLEHGSPVVRQTRVASAAASVDISFQGLVYFDKKGRKKNRSVNIQVEYRLVGTDTWTLHEVKNCVESTSAYVRFTSEIIFPSEGQYDIRLTRQTLDSTDSSVRDLGNLTAIRSIQSGSLPSHNDIAEIAVRIKASNELNGQIQSLNGVVQQLAPVWDGDAWSAPQPVRHPAWQYARALMGPQLRDPVSDTQIALSDLKAWADAEPHWTCDMVIDSRTRLADVLDLICACGRVKRGMSDLKYSIIRDGGAGGVVQHFTPRNSWGFTARRFLDREIHAFRVRVVSERKGWAQDEIMVYMDGHDANTATEIETLSLPGIVLGEDGDNEGNAWRIARYHLAVATLRPEEFHFNCELDHIPCQLGDKVRVVHDVPLFGVGAGRITDVTVNVNGRMSRFEMDEVLDTESGVEYRVRVRRSNGSELMIGATFTGSFWDLTTNSTTIVNVGDLVMIEKMTEATVELVVTGVTHTGDLQAKITAVPAAPAVLTADGSAIPPYDPQITTPYHYGPPKPVVLSARSGVDTAIVERDNSLTPRIGVVLGTMIGAQTSSVWLSARWRKSGSTRWEYGPKIDYQSEMFTGPLEDGEAYEVSLASWNANGDTQGWVYAGSTVASIDDNTLQVPAWSAVAGVDTITLHGSVVENLDRMEYRIYAATASSNVLTLIGQTVVPHFIYRPDPADGYTRYKVVAVAYGGREGTYSGFITVSPTGVTSGDLAGDVAGLITTAQQTADDAAADALGALQDAAIVQAEHDTLTAGFSGTLAAALTQRDVALQDAISDVDADLAARDLTIGTAQQTADDAIQDALQAQGDVDALEIEVSGLSSTFERSVGVLEHPFLDDATWDRWAADGVLTKVTNEEFGRGETWGFDVTSTQRDGLAINSSHANDWPGQQNADGYVMEVDFTLVNGVMDGAGFYIAWYNTGNSGWARAKTLSECVSGDVLIGRRSTARVLLKRPEGYVGDFDRHLLHLFANWEGFAGDMGAKNIKFHRALVRVATQEELDQEQIETDLSSVTADLVTEQVTRAQGDAALAADITSLTTNLGNITADLSQNYYTISEVTGAIAASELGLQSNIDAVNANLTNNYYTSAQTDSAVTIATTALQASMEAPSGSIGSLSAALTSDYSTTVDMNAAISASQLTLQSNIDDVAADLTSEQTTRAAADSALVADVTKLTATIQAGDGVITDPFLESIGTGNWNRWAANGTFTQTPNEQFPIGQTFRWDVTATQTDGLNHASTRSGWIGHAGADGYVVEVDWELNSGSVSGAGVYLRWTQSGTSANAIAKLEDGLAGPVALNENLTSRFLLRKPASVSGDFVSHTLHFFANWGGLGVAMAAKTIAIHRYRIRVATQEELDLGVVQTGLQAEIDDIKALDVSGTTAFGNLMTQLAVNANGASATIQQHATAVADQNGFASAFAGVSVETDGGGVAGFKATSWTNPDGTGGSTLDLLGGTVRAGTMAVDRLVTGVGKNLVQNSDFSQGTRFWSGPSGPSGGVLNETQLLLRPAGQTHAGATYPTFQINQNGTATTGYADAVTVDLSASGAASALAIPVTPGDWYMASAYFAALGCQADILLVFRNATGGFVGQSIASVPQNSASSSNPDTWPRHHIKGQAPAGAAFVQLYVRKYGTLLGTGSNILFHKPMIEPTHASASTPSPWSQAGNTLIDGGNGIFDGTLTASKLVANTITAASGVIGDAAVDTLQIAGQAVTVPVRSQLLTLHPLTVTNSWVTVMDVVIDRQGYATELTVGGDYHSITAGVPTGICGLRFVRLGGVGTVIGPETAMVTGPSGSRTTWTMKRTDNDLGVGATTYRLQAQKRTDGSNTANTEIIYPWMTLHQFKR